MKPPAENSPATPVVPKAPADTPQAKQAENKPQRSGSTPSIKDALSSIGKSQSKPDDDSGNGEDSIQGEQAGKPVVAENVSAEKLKELWEEYIKQIKDESPRLHLALSSQEPELLEDGVSISIAFRNNTLLTDFRQTYKIPLLAFLKEQLNNQLLEFKEQVLDIETESSSKHYTDQDKLKYMAEKNPAIQKLAQDFKLDFE